MTPAPGSSANCMRMAAAMSAFADGCAHEGRRFEALDVAAQWLELARWVETPDPARQPLLRLRALAIATQTSATLRQPLVCDLSGFGVPRLGASLDS